MNKTEKCEQVDQTLVNHRDVVNEYFRLVGAGKFKEGVRFFTSNCVTHNPYVKGNMDTLAGAQISAFKNGVVQNPQAHFAVRYVLVDGDMAAAYTQLLGSKSDLARGGLRQVHLFRFEGDKIAEYWDISQFIAESMPNARGAF